MVSSSSSTQLSSPLSGIPTSSRLRPASETWNHTCSTNAQCLTMPSSVVADGTSRARACSSVRPSSSATTSVRLSCTNASSWARSLPMRVSSLRYCHVGLRSRRTSLGSEVQPASVSAVRRSHRAATPTVAGVGGVGRTRDRGTGRARAGRRSPFAAAPDPPPAGGRRAARRGDPEVFAAQCCPGVAGRATWDAFYALQRATASTEIVVRFLDAFASSTSTNRPRGRGVRPSCARPQRPPGAHRAGPRAGPTDPGPLAAAARQQHHILTAQETAWPALLEQLDRFVG